MTTSNLRRPKATILAQARALISAYDHESIRDLPQEERLEKAVQRSGFPSGKQTNRLGSLNMVEEYLISVGGRAAVPDIARNYGLTLSATRSILQLLVRRKLVQKTSGAVDTFEILRN